MGWSTGEPALHWAPAGTGEGLAAVGQAPGLTPPAGALLCAGWGCGRLSVAPLRPVLPAQVIEATISKHRQNSQTFRAFSSAFSTDGDRPRTPEPPVSAGARLCGRAWVDTWLLDAGPGSSPRPRHRVALFSAAKLRLQATWLSSHYLRRSASVCPRVVWRERGRGRVLCRTAAGGGSWGQASLCGCDGQGHVWADPTLLGCGVWPEPPLMPTVSVPFRQRAPAPRSLRWPLTAQGVPQG